MSRPALAAALATLSIAAAAPAAAQAQDRATAATAVNRTIDADGVRLAYRDFGTGRPIVFVMGLGGTMDGWDPKFLDAVAAKRRRVIVFDNEGMGRSKQRRGTLTIRRMADDTAALMRKLKIRKADVFGWSMGGMISQSLAVRHPKLVRRLVLAATAPGDGKATGPSERAIAGLANPGEQANLMSFLFPPGHDDARDAYIRNLLTRKRRNLDAGARGAQLAAAGQWVLGQDRDGKRIAKLRIPVLVGGGALDELLPVANQRHLARVIPRARRVIYDDASHGFFLQERADFVARVKRFFGR